MNRWLLAVVLVLWARQATADVTPPPPVTGTPPPPVPVPVTPSCSESSCQSGTPSGFRLCSCDAYCTKYGDCCHDAPVAVTPPLDPRFTCVRQVRDYWMVTSCSREWMLRQVSAGLANVAQIVASCEDPAVRATFAYLPPVTDEATQLVYLNEYCAQCNGLSSSDVAGWRVQLKCQENATALTSKTTVTVSEFLQFCTIPFYLAPSTSLLPDECRRDVPPPFLTTTCPDSASAAEKNRCTNGGINVFQFNMNQYANGHCALCHGEDPVDPSTCARDMVTQPTDSPMDLGNLAILFDIFGTGRTASSSTATYTVVQEACPSGSVYDVFRASCRALPSANCSQSTGSVTLQQGAYSLVDTLRVYWPSYNLTVSIESVNTNGRPIVCIPNVESDLCVPIFLDANEYILENATTNTSLLLLSSNVSYVIEGFDMNGRPLICTNFSQTFSSTNTTVTTVFTYPIAFNIITYIGLFVDLLCGSFYLFTFIIFKDLRTFFSKLTVNFIISILLGDLIFLIGGPLFTFISVPELCTIVGILLHYVFLTRFSWMSVMGTELMRSFYNVKKLNTGATENVKALLLYMAIAWLTPLLVVIPTVIVNFSVEGSVNYGVGSSCWINNLVANVVTFVVPVCLSVVYNTVAFVIVIVVLVAIRNRPLNNPSGKERRKQIWKDVRFAVALFTLTGLSWLFGFMALFSNVLSWAWYLFIIFNSTEAVSIAVAFLFTKKVFRMYRSLLCCESHRGQHKVSSGSRRLTKETLAKHTSF